MNTETIFNDLGVDAIVGSQLMETLGISSDELSLPNRFERLHYIIKFLKQFPLDTQKFLISKATRNKMVDKLDQMFEYTNLLKQKSEYEEMLNKIGTEETIVGSGSPLIQEIANRSLDIRKNLKQVVDEIQIYEK